jgi:hypothetical protein
LNKRLKKSFDSEIRGVIDFSKRLFHLFDGLGEWLLSCGTIALYGTFVFYYWEDLRSAKKYITKGPIRATDPQLGE